MNNAPARLIPFSILFFVFFRLITDFVEAIYAFGLLGTSIPLETAAVVLLFAPALLLFLRRDPSERGLIYLGELVLIAGALEVILDTRGRMIVSGIGVGLFLVFLPALLSVLASKRNASGAFSIGGGLALALPLTILFRAWNSGVDPSSVWIGQGLHLLLAATAALLLPGEIGRIGSRPDEWEDLSRRKLSGPTTALCLGVIAALALLYFAFGSPNVIARWNGMNYWLVLALTAFALSAFAVLLIALAGGRVRISSPGLLLWNLLFTAALTASILPTPLRLPTDPGSYPFYEQATGLIPDLLLAVAILLFPVILLDFIRFCQALIDRSPGIRALGAGFTLASGFLLFVILAQVFTTVYDYIPLVGPLFRGRFWLVFLVLGLALTFVSLLLPPGSPGGRAVLPKALPGAVIVLSAAAVAGAYFTSARPIRSPEQARPLRILTYNIQQGYTAGGQKGHLDQLELLKRIDADLVGLQESDTNRISGGNSDLVRFFADRLNLYSYYGPKVTAGTFGIALLSKYPIQNPRTFYLPSQGEQTAGIQAEITVGERIFHVFVTHLGNDGPLVQQQTFLREVALNSDIIAMGDFNFTPQTEQYRKTIALLQDSWLARWPAGEDDQGHLPADRIDHIFISPGLEVKAARYLSGPESDHPAYVIEILP